MVGVNSGRLTKGFWINTVEAVSWVFIVAAQRAGVVLWMCENFNFWCHKLFKSSSKKVQIMAVKIRHCSTRTSIGSSFIKAIRIISRQHYLALQISILEPETEMLRVLQESILGPLLFTAKVYFKI